ncbi:MAG: SpoIID/LytB domain-containing protein [bacterium]
MKIFAYIWALLAAVALLAPGARAFGLPPPEVRVLVEEGPRVVIDGMGQSLRIRLGEGKNASEFSAGTSAAVATSGDGLSIGGQQAGKEAVIQNSNRLYRIGSRTYRGTITAIWQTPSRIILVNNVPVEEYLVGLIGSEISPAWPIEAIKAQAVAARTYALNQTEASRRGSARPYDVTSTVLSQVYDGAHKEDERSRSGVVSTRGQILTRGGALFAAYFHSCCGGLTEHAHNVWPGEEGPPTVEDRFCERSPKRLWSFQMDAARFVAKLKAAGLSVGEILGLSTESESDSPRVENLLMQDREGNKSVAATELRRIFGYSEIKSTWFDAKLDSGQITLVGRGYGHGVGMCQWGAKGMADEGAKYGEILKFYYPDAELYTAY